MDNFNAENVLKLSDDNTNFDKAKKFIKKEIIERAEAGYMSYSLDSLDAGIKTIDCFKLICRWLEGLGFETGQPRSFHVQVSKEMKYKIMIEWKNRK